MPAGSEGAAAPASFREAIGLWLKIGCISFGGPAGQIAMMHTEVVDRRRWIDEAVFLGGLNFCSLLPGPEAQQLATYIGWRLHGVRGGIASGLLFVLPGALLMLLLSWLAAAKGNQPWLAAAFEGLKPVVVAIIFVSVWRLGRRALRGWLSIVLASAAFVALFGLGIGFPWVVLGAAAIGGIAGRSGRTIFGGGVAGGRAVPPADAVGTASVGPLHRIARLIALFAGLWSLPVVAVIAVFGTEPFVDIAKLFTTAAFVTFGGAYAVLPFVADGAVNDLGWLTRGDMLNGLALAETTPGPLILVLQYVGFFAGWNASGEGLSTALAAAALTTYLTFLPSFLFIFAGAPYIERIHAVPSLSAALAAINAAIVGVILNLGVYFAIPVFFGSDLGSAAFPWLVAGVTAAVLLRFSIGLHWVIAAGAALGIIRWLL